MLDRNQRPYFNDYDLLKNYVEVLFRPGIAVQARELTQLQTALQNQLASNARHIFNDGSNVTNAAVSVAFNQDWVRLENVDSATNAVTVDESYIGRVFQGATSNATFEVTGVNASNNTLYVSLYAGTLQVGEDVDIDPSDTASPTSLPGIVQSVGQAIRANNDPGIIFAGGYFIQTFEQEIIVQEDGTTGNYDIGFLFTDSFVTVAEDGSLVDPADGSFNENAPGADRYKTEMVLTAVRDGDPVPDDFYAFVTIENGSVIRTHNDVQYSDIMDLLAARTFDESGNYTVEDFPISVQDDPNDESKLDVILDAGNAYVQGYNYRTISPTKLSLDKPRTSKLANNVNLYSSYGTFFLAQSITGGVFDVSKKETVQLFSAINGGGTEIAPAATIRIVGIHNISPNTRVYLSGVSDIQSVLGSVRSIVSGSKVINVFTRDIEQDRLTGTITEALYGISPNPAPIFPTQNKRVKEIVLNETIYDSQRSYINFTNKVGADFVISASDSQTDFEVGSPIVSIYESGTSNDLSGSAIPSVNNVNGGSSSITISGLGAFSSIDVLVRTQETQANPKTKNLTQTSQTFTASGTTQQLNQFDVFEIVSITKDGLAQDVNSVVLNSGQTDYYYDFGSVSGLEDGADYVITYRYFAHAGTGDYFSVNSYINSGNLAIHPDMYGRIGRYTSISGLISYELSDCLDFRRTISDINSGTDIPSPESSIFVDYEYFLPRVDKVYLSRDGEFGIQKGIPTDFADIPNDVPNTMTLYTLDMPGFVTSPEEVEVSIEDNTRYTMSDIGRLENRISNLEYYTSLSMVENETNSLTVLDEEGNTKFKNGILVDSFQDHSIGDVDDDLYLVSIDEQERLMQPTFDVDSVDLRTQQEIYSQNFPNGIPGISVNANTYSLSFNETNMISQLRASETINVNPYNVFVWYGDVTLAPSGDNWIDTEFKPSVTVSIDGNVDAFRKQANFMGTQWNSWQTTWSGVTDVNRTVNRQRGRTTVDRSNWRRGPHGTWLTRVTDVRTTTTTTTTRKTAQTRTGRRLNVGSKWTKKNLGSRVVDTRIIPIIRSRLVQIRATGLKPVTTMRAFFDGVDVTANCRGGTTQAGPVDMITDAAGNLTGNFLIPGGQFRTGTRDFVLMDDENNPSTEGKTTYTASGLLQTKEQQILSIEQPVITTATVSQNRVLTSTSTRASTNVTQERSRPYDPIAQSFFVDEEGGLFVTSVEVFFKTKDAALPVSLEIVSNDNGYPSTFTLPFAKTVLFPNDVNISEDGSVGTTFTFSDPVYLEHLGDYSFVMKSNSNRFTVFIGKIGGTDVLDGKLISDQPYIGSLFKSQNAFTWNADQESDIKFNINRAEFDIDPANILLQDIAGATNQPFTAFMPNIDEMAVEGTAIDLFYKVAASGTIDLSTAGYTSVLNKSNELLNAQTTFDSANSPLRFLVGMFTNKPTISPIIHRFRNSVITVNNYSVDDGEVDFNAGNYVTKTTTLAEAADDLKVLIDVEKQAGSDIDVYYKIGEVVPKFIEYEAGQTKQNGFEGKRVYIYHLDTSNEASLQASMITTNIEESSNRYFGKQISDVGSFIDDADWTTNGLASTNGVIVTTDEELDGLTVDPWSAAVTYDRVQDNAGPSYVSRNGKYWKSNLSGNLNLEPGTGYAWQEVPFMTLVSELQDNVRQEWQPMVVEDEIDPSVDTSQFIEYSYRPANSIREDFTQYSIRVNLRVTDAARIPRCRELRVLALS